MGKFDIDTFKYITKEDFRILIAIEMGMKNHEIVPAELVTMIAGIGSANSYNILRQLCKKSLVCHEKTKKGEGFRLTVLGYDYLAINAIKNRDVIDSIGCKIGVGKESDVYLASNSQSEIVVAKFHRLGRICFRKIKEKREYHQKRSYASWMYLSRISALKEFQFMKVLHEFGFNVPRPIDFNRNLVIMEKIEGIPLCQLNSLENPEDIYDQCMNIIVELGENGLIHGDFNEFNLIIESDKNSKEIVRIIDFPQMVSINHRDAQYYFDRDVNGIVAFFSRKFNHVSESIPNFSEIKRKNNIDITLKASGFNNIQPDFISNNSSEEDNEGHYHSCDSGSSEHDKETHNEEMISQKTKNESSLSDDNDNNSICQSIRKKLNIQTFKNQRHLAVKNSINKFNLNRRRELKIQCIEDRE